MNIRTMEFCRRWGVAQVVQECPFPPDYPLDVAFVTSLSGCELGRMPVLPRMSAPGPYSPVRQQVCSQMWFDPILQRHARTFPQVELRYRARLELFEGSSSGVSAEIVDLPSGRRERLDADYLVGCDGANSTVRRTLGIGWTGHGVLDRSLNLFFRTPDLPERCGKRTATTFIAIDDGGPWAILRAIDPANALWRLMVLGIDASQTLESIDRPALLRRMIGRPIEVDWVGASLWTRCSTVAERYGNGRVFLAGDAVHQFSPTGGQGMNTGIADAVDLGWKLAAVFGGWGGTELLASYEDERRPIAVRNVGFTTEFFFDRPKFDDRLAALDEAGHAGAQTRNCLGDALVRNVARMFRTTGLQLGYRYEGSFICWSDGTSPDPDDPEHYVPSARPGARAPHLWLRDGRSMLDLFGRGFVLLRLGRAAPDTSKFKAAATARSIPLDIVALSDHDAIELYGQPLVLVRPDGHVAWRSDELPPDPAAILDRIRGYSH